MKRFYFIFLVFFVFFFDRIIKLLILNDLPKGKSIPILENSFHLTHVQNSGAAFGFFGEHPQWLLAFSFICVSLILFYLLWELFFSAHAQDRIQKGDWLDAWAWSLILGGAVGNLYDRFYYGVVIDYLDFRIWPVFNLADACITIGASLLVLYFLKHKTHSNTKSST